MDKLAKLKQLGEKYAVATEVYDDIIEDGFVLMRPMARKLVNQIGKEILEICNDK